jgi:L-arabinose isomerase
MSPAGLADDRMKVALIDPYWAFWERSVAYDLRAEREELVREVRAAFDVEWVEPEQAEAQLVLQTMATPPADTLARLTSVPVVIWAAQRLARIPDTLDHGAITAEGATVGTPMLTSVLVREGRPFELVLGLIEDPKVRADVLDALRAAVVATRIAHARIARIGRPLPGYLCVDTDDAQLRRLTGIELVAIEPAEVLELYRAVDGASVERLEAEVRRDYDVEIGGESLERSLRAAIAIDELVARHGLHAGAMNCHVPELRLNPEFGIAPCLALGRSTTAGVPWTCVGDVLTAVAMLVGKLLTGAAQYHELEALDHRTGEFAIASSGEFDLGFAPAVRPRLIANRWFASDPCQGGCACFSAAAGPATLIGFADAGAGYRLIAAQGELTGRSWPDSGTANGAFRFSGGVEGWRNWCLAGANHHSSASPHAVAAQVLRVARLMGIEGVAV